MQFIKQLGYASALLCISLGAHALPIQWSVNGHYYDVVQYRADYATAEKIVAAMGDKNVHLAKIDSEEEGNFLKEHHPMLWLCNTYDDCKSTFTYGVWLGAKQTSTEDEPSGNWAWQDGTLLSHQAWKSGEPNNSSGSENCLATNLDGQWNDQNCDRILEGFIVEYDTLPEQTSYLATVPLQWTKANGGNDHWYQRILQVGDWETAKTTAASKTWQGVKGHLVTIGSATENAFLITSFLGKLSNSACVTPSELCASTYAGQYWLGGQWDNTLKLTWITGEETTFSSSIYPTPSNNFTGLLPLASIREGEYWAAPTSSTNTTNNKGYIIEYEGTAATVPSIASNECLARYSLSTGKLVIPCLAVELDANNTVYYQLNMQQDPNFKFDVQWDSLQERK